MAPHDIIIDDDEECCPLCVEEFDLSDKNFRPCPCGYQVCQFCFNNIKTNMNGLCPACRRPYDEKTIEWKVVTPEEVAQFKANLQKNAKKKQEQRQKEAQKREVESLNRKHLSGLRVVQKNLVYVVGLNPNVAEREILETLRGDKYFGQYGKIIKIVVSNKKDSSASGQPQSLGVYVTFARKEDAARCITAVNGSQNGDRVLRAQLGTTKYCSAYLRNETCTNKNCMFLHEPGDNDDSYSRQDLSSINSVNTQRPLPAMPTSSASSSRQAAQAQAQAQVPIQQAQPVAAAVQPMARDISKDGSDSSDGSALPTTSNWGSRSGAPHPSRRGSQANSAAASSPAPAKAVPATADSTVEPQQEDSPLVSNALPSPATAPTDHAPGPDRDPSLVALMKHINSSEVCFTRPVSTEQASNMFSSFPPLFDEFGGAKRRAMREQQEEARLSLEQDSQSDPLSVQEALDEEATQGGSFQLGGEPEDRDNSREGGQPPNFHGSRRPSTQAPIHRGINGGPFGPSLPQSIPLQNNIGNLSSINGRTLTAHQQNQLALMKSTQVQPGYMDQYPPRTGNFDQIVGLLQQQQGHNRQSSRYNFGIDGSSTSSSVKPSANPKLMAQQSSMMPSVPHNTQSYGSMPGPPPGLKSTATPPIGGMFSQGNGFNSMGGSAAFGGGQREPNEFLQQMFRAGNRGGQSHDTGKREYKFSPSFLQQYPSSSSTPAPASGFLASLYGPQTGAFQDYGQKQKKKGKKHRHANTSSSGGGGLVNDLADPSILQARMHHQQSSAGVGQVFGGQVQDDLGLLALDADVTSSIDALVADDDSIPPSLNNSNQVSRSSTPAVPPGFSLPHAHPPPVIREEPVTKVPSRFVPTSAPFTPARNTATSRIATPLSTVTVQTTLHGAPKSKAAVSASQAKRDVKVLATNTGLSKAIASQSSKPALQSEDFPALESGKAKVQATPSSSKLANTVKPAVSTSSRKPSTTPAPVLMSAPTGKAVEKEKRNAPAVNTPVPKKPIVKTLVIETPTATAAPVKSLPPTDYPSLPPSTSTAVQSPRPRPAMKSIRVVPTPKTENPPPGNATPSSATSMFPPSLTSRQASLALRPGTPSSEIISDNASFTSASMSRANSPPPTKIGSAPVRENTKAAARRLRKEKAEAKERLEAETRAKMAEQTPEVEIVPIIGRKKKQKKERITHSAAGGSTPVISRPPSPGPAELVPDEPKSKPVVVEPAAPAAQKQVSMEQETSKVPIKGHDSKGKGKAKAQPTISPEPTPPAPEVEDEPADKPIPTPASVFQRLVEEGLIDDVDQLYLLKNPTAHYQIKTPIDPQTINQKLTISPEDRQALLAGEPVVKVADGPNRILLTPNGDCIRNLTAEEEQRFLDLQTSIAEEFGPASFTSAKHHASNGFALIGGRAVPNGPPTFFPVSSTGGPAMDPVSKIQRDEALSYINQYVLPSLSTNQQLEKALNTNAIDPEIIRSGDAAAWTNWGGDNNVNPARRSDNSAEPGHAPTPTNREGMIATGLESMTAQFAIAGDLSRGQPGQPLGNVSLLSLSEAEGALQIARKETEGFEKRLNALIKKNRRLLLPSSH